MDSRYSENELAEFLDYVCAKGLIKEATAKSRKVAALKVLSALDDHEKIDLRNLDRDLSFQRFVNKLGKEFSPDSLATYKSRFNSALDDFLRYVENPAAFKPGGSQRTSRKGKDEGDAASKASIKRNEQEHVPSPPSMQHAQGTMKIIFPIPLREGVVVQIHNLPMDLTAAEAQRISAVINALAVSSASN